MLARDIVGHSMQIDPQDLIERGYLRLTGPTRTWLDLAALLTLHELVAVGDYLIRWRMPLATVGELGSALERYPSRTGVRVAAPPCRSSAPARNRPANPCFG
jgi:hypothetical protein